MMDRDKERGITKGEEGEVEEWGKGGVEGGHGVWVGERRG